MKERKQLIATKRFGRYRVGDDVRLPGAVARVLVARGYLAEAPPTAPAAALLTPKREYKRRDMVPADTKAPTVPAAVTPYVEPVPATPVAPIEKPTPVSPPWRKPTVE